MNAGESKTLRPLARTRLLAPLGPLAHLRLLAIAAAFWAGAVTLASGAEANAGGRVVIKDFMFAPVALTVKAGSVVSWTNQDSEPHTVASDAGVFRSGALDTNESFSFKFEKPGTYRFLCSIHPYMVGTITVEP